jgi:hypothetical protein
MSDKQEQPNLSDDLERGDSALGAGQPPLEGNVKSDAAGAESLFPPDEEQDSNGQDAADEDVLADIRRSLVEEESKKREKKKRGIFQRVSRLIKSKKSPPPATAAAPDQGDMPPVPAVGEVEETVNDAAGEPSGGENVPVAETDQTSRDEAKVEEAVAAFIADIESLASDSAEPQVEAPPAPEEEETVAAEALRIKPAAETYDKSIETIREVALEDYGSSPITTEPAPVLPWRKKTGLFFKRMKPFERFLIFGSVTLMCIAGLAGLGLIGMNARPTVDATPAPTLERPIPVRVALPGGWEFNLGRGGVEDGRWSPRGAEWLEGTELCKWVALPWSLQLEAVVRTLKSDDPISLTMSNADELLYKVYSVREMPVDQIESLETTKTCLLLILVNKDADTRWVVTAIP